MPSRHTPPSRHESDVPIPRRTSRPADPRVRATAKREALRMRARRIRRTVAAAAAALFCTVFLVVYVQLVSGHDPGLSATSKNSATAESGGNKSAAIESSATPSAVTTSQS